MGCGALAIGKQLPKFRNRIVSAYSGHTAQIIGAPPKPLEIIIILFYILLKLHLDITYGR